MAAQEKKTTATTARTTKTAEAKPKRATRRKAAPAVTEAMIAERAYWISQSPECASDEENWLRAEAELQPA
jgi:hypothetical protein